MNGIYTLREFAVRLVLAVVFVAIGLPLLGYVMVALGAGS